MIDDSILENYVSKIPTITLDRKLKMSPIQTIYGGAHLFSSSSIQKLGHIAKTTFAENLSNHEQLRHFIKGITATEKLSLLSNQSIFQTEEKFFKILYDRVINKLNSSAVEDLRIDFEDGFGIRSDEEEDMECSRAAAELILMIKSNTMPQKIGIRIKSLTSNPRRSLKTLYLFLSTVLNMAVLPQNFVVTIPKIRSPREIEVLDEFLSMIENKFGLENKIPIELLVELPESIVNNNGEFILPQFIKASNNRCQSIHIGVYDYTSAMDVSAESQTLFHPVGEFQRLLTQLLLKQLDVALVDGATNILPIAKYKNATLDSKEFTINRSIILSSWRVSFTDITESLRRGIYRGWDLHPNQLPIRYVAVFYFFLINLDSTLKRLNQFMNSNERATRTDVIFDDAATVRGLINHILLGFNCGAISQSDLDHYQINLNIIKNLII